MTSVTETALDNTSSPFPIIRCSVPDVSDEDRAAVDRVLRSGWIGAGPVVRELELELRRHVRSGEVVTFSSATAALAATLHVRGVGTGSKVVVGALGFAAVINAIRILGAHPVVVDVTPDGDSLDLDQVEAALRRGAAAVVPLAWRGEPSNTSALARLCDVAGATLVEDGAYALGSVRDDATTPGPRCPVVVSFHPTKIITGGLGGAVLGVSAVEAAQLRSFRNQGLTTPAWSRRDRTTTYAFQDVGFALEMSDVHAAIALSQLRRLDQIVLLRRAIFLSLTQHIGQGIAVCPSSGRTAHGWSNASMFAVRLQPECDRDTVSDRLLAVGIGSAVHYPFLADQPAVRPLVAGKQFPNAQALSAGTLTLPSHPSLTMIEIARIADALTQAVDG